MVNRDNKKANGRHSFMVHSVSGWTRGVQVKLWNPLRMRAVPEHLRGVFTTRRYINPCLPLPYLNKRVKHWSCNEGCVFESSRDTCIKCFWAVKMMFPCSQDEEDSEEKERDARSKRSNERRHERLGGGKHSHQWLWWRHAVLANVVPYPTIPSLLMSTYTPLYRFSYLIISQLPNTFHRHFATPLEYVISLISWSLGCVLIYLTLAALYCLKIPLLLIKIKRSK